MHKIGLTHTRKQVCLTFWVAELQKVLVHEEPQLLVQLGVVEQWVEVLGGWILNSAATEDTGILSWHIHVKGPGKYEQ